MLCLFENSEDHLRSSSVLLLRIKGFMMISRSQQKVSNFLTLEIRKGAVRNLGHRDGCFK